MCFKTTASSDDDGPQRNCTTLRSASTVPRGGRPLQMGTAPHRARLQRYLMGDGLCKWELHHIAPGFNGTSWGTPFANGSCTALRLRHRNGVYGFGAETVPGFGTETVLTDKLDSAPRRCQASAPKRQLPEQEPNTEMVLRPDSAPERCLATIEFGLRCLGKPTSKPQPQNPRSQHTHRCGDCHAVTHTHADAVTHTHTQMR